MLVEKEVIRDGTYWSTDLKTGLPRKIVVTPELRQHWHDQGNLMLGDNLSIPIPYEHDFSVHPMTPKDALLKNAGEVKQFRMDGNKLVSTLNIVDPEVAKKIENNSIRWTSPWFNTFMDGSGKKWDNVISHLALTTRPRANNQDSFTSIAAALSMAPEIKTETPTALDTGSDGYCLSPAGLLGTRKSDKQLAPRFPVAFSLLSGVPLSDDNFMSKKKSSKDKKSSKSKKLGSGDKPGNTPPPEDDDDDGDDADEGGEDFIEDGEDGVAGDKDGKKGNVNINDVSMEELLCDLLGALGIPLQHSGNEEMFKRELYNAAMTKIHELTAKGQQDPNKQPGNRTNPPGQPPNKGQPNPLIQQEQQPMYMSLDDINKLPDPMKGVALSMYNENVKLRAEMDVDRKKLNSLNDAKLKEEKNKRDTRVSLLSRLSPRVKTDLDAMLVLPSMALSMGDGGEVVDPMAQTLMMLEKGLADIPRLLTADHTALSIHAHPKDEDALTDERVSEIADGLARQMGCPPQAKAS